MRLGDERGQAAVELVALLPVLLAVAAIAWQLALAGHAAAAAASAARAASRAHALGEDERAAAMRMLPGRLERGALVRLVDGTVRVRVRVPAVLVGGTLTTVSRQARYGAPG